MSIAELCRTIACPSCGALHDQACRTLTGRRASSPHSARWIATERIWMRGFDVGVHDAVERPDWARNWVERSA